MQKIIGKEELALYNELKKLAKKANQRILRLERLTGLKGEFATKQLYDYLNSNELKAISEKGRIKVRKDFTLLQYKAIIKATNEFLESDESKVSGLKNLQREYSIKAKKSLSFKQLSTLYKAKKNYTWIYEYIPKSEFWALVNVSKEEKWNKETFIIEISNYINEEIDLELKKDLEDLYYYIME